MKQSDSERELDEARLRERRDRHDQLQGAVQEGEERGEKKGREKGRLVERIQMCQELLKLPLTPEDDLLALSIEELKPLADRLKKQALSLP